MKKIRKQPSFIALTFGQGRQLCNAALCSGHVFKRHFSKKLCKALCPAFHIEERKANL